MKAVILLGALLITFFSTAQTDFDYYEGIKCEGEVPSDFFTSTKEKISLAKKEKFPDLTAAEKKEFILSVNYSIDQLLTSGAICYGDPVSKFIQQIGDRLTENVPELEGELRYYVMKDNVANAFSTAQGIVFVTTGLIAQMSDEAQLAFVIAHEIVHYLEKHVLNYYNYVTDNLKSLTYGEKYRFFSKYSRENELEADVLGVKMYHDAGYTSQNVSRTFDVLVYQHLPFEELSFSKSYFNTPMMFVPENSFPVIKNEIKVDDYYDDRFESHPNLDKRRYAINQEVSKLSDWKETVNFDQDAFYEVQNICRFQHIKENFEKKLFVETLYGIFILEKRFPNSHYLRRLKAQTWLEMIKIDEEDQQVYNSGPYSRRSNFRYSYYQGELSILGGFIDKMEPLQKTIHALRIIYDTKQLDTTDKIVQRLWDRTLVQVARQRAFKIEKCAQVNFDQAIVEKEKHKLEKDTAKVETSAAWNKYETIERLKSGVTLEEEIDSTKYYLYGISDLIVDSVFLNALKTQQALNKEKEIAFDDQLDLTDSELELTSIEEKEEKLKLENKRILMLNPAVEESIGFQDPDLEQGEKTAEILTQIIQNEAIRQGLQMEMIDRSDLKNISTEEINDFGFVLNCFEKSVKDKRNFVYELDQEKLSDIRKKYNVDYAMFVRLDHHKLSSTRPGMILLQAVLFPIGMFSGPINYVHQHSSSYETYILDLRTGELQFENSEEFYEPSKPAFFKLYFERFFKKMNS